jgi:hypothetical protein
MKKKHAPRASAFTSTNNPRIGTTQKAASPANRDLSPSPSPRSVRSRSTVTPAAPVFTVEEQEQHNQRFGLPACEDQWEDTDVDSEQEEEAINELRIEQHTLQRCLWTHDEEMGWRNGDYIERLVIRLSEEEEVERKAPPKRSSSSHSSIHRSELELFSLCRSLLKQSCTA